MAWLKVSFVTSGVGAADFDLADFETRDFEIPDLETADLEVEAFEPRFETAAPLLRFAADGFAAVLFAIFGESGVAVPANRS